MTRSNAGLLLVLSLLLAFAGCVVRPMHRVDREEFREHECIDGRGPGGRPCDRHEWEHEHHEHHD